MYTVYPPGNQHIPSQKALLKIIFLIRRWDMSVIFLEGIDLDLVEFYGFHVGKYNEIIPYLDPYMGTIRMTGGGRLDHGR